MVQHRLKPLAEWSLADLEAVRLLLRGESVIDWHRLNFVDADEVRTFLASNELYVGRDDEHLESLKIEAMTYVRRHFDFPIPRKIEALAVPDLILLASGKGHKQLCACTILKAMHIIHHLEGRELLFMLPLADLEVFHLVEEKVNRIVGGMLAEGLPLVEFVGGRKNKYSLFTKLLSKKENIAAQIYDKQRFRIVTREREDIFPVINHLLHRLLAFNYVIPGESTNTIFQLKSYCRSHPRLRDLISDERLNGEEKDELTPSANSFSDASFRIIHFVVDLPIRVPEHVLAAAPAAAKRLGPVIFVLTELQIIDRDTEMQNELGDASHERYKERQREAVMRRLKLGARGLEVTPTPPPVRVVERPERPEKLDRKTPVPSPPRRSTPPPPPRGQGNG